MRDALARFLIRLANWLSPQAAATAKTDGGGGPGEEK